MDDGCNGYSLSLTLPAYAQAKDAAPPALTVRAQVLLMLALFAMTCALFIARLDHPLLEPEEGR